MVAGSSPASSSSFYNGAVAQLVEHVIILSSIFPDKYGACSSVGQSAGL